MNNVYIAYAWRSSNLPVTCVQRAVTCSNVWQTIGQRSERIYNVCVASVLRMINVLDVRLTYDNILMVCSSCCDWTSCW